MSKTVKPPMERWLSKVVEFDGHWLWTGRLQRSALPVLDFTIAGKRTVKPARHLMWRYLHGPVKEGYCIRASCGIKSCVHPKHMIEVEIGSWSKK